MNSDAVIKVCDGQQMQMVMPPPFEPVGVFRVKMEGTSTLSLRVGRLNLVVEAVGSVSRPPTEEDKRWTALQEAVEAIVEAEIDKRV